MGKERWQPGRLTALAKQKWQLLRAKKLSRESLPSLELIYEQLKEQLQSLSWQHALMVMALGFLLATGTTSLLGVLLFPDLPTSVQTSGSARSTQSLLPLKTKPSLDPRGMQQILTRNLFNKDGETGEEKEGGADDNQGPASSEPVKSTLPFKLMGTIFGGDPYSGIALIEATDEKSLNSFFVGDFLEENVQVSEIHREKVILQHGDRREFLELQQNDLAGSRRKRGSAVAAAPALSNDTPPDQYKEEGFERHGTSITMSADYRKKLLSTDFAKVLQDAKAEPHLVGGELSGFRLTRIRPDSIYLKAGLRDGDIIKEINGVSLVDTAQSIKLLNSLRGENELDVRLERGGSPVSITLQVR